MIIIERAPGSDSANRSPIQHQKIKGFQTLYFFFIGVNGGLYSSFSTPCSVVFVRFWVGLVALAVANSAVNFSIFSACCFTKFSALLNWSLRVLFCPCKLAKLLFNSLRSARYFSAFCCSVLVSACAFVSSFFRRSIVSAWAVFSAVRVALWVVNWLIVSACCLHCSASSSAQH